MTVQAVFFDMGGTIETYGWTPELRIQATRGIQQRFEDAGVHLSMSDKQLYELVSKGLERYHRWSIQTLDELPPQRVWNEYILANCSVDSEKVASLAEDLMLYIETNYYERAMRPEVPEVLEAVRAMGLKIGLISNVNSLGQVPTNLNKYGVRHYFDPVVLSSEYGRRKPDPAIFHYAARLASVPTGRCVYVGDRIARDVLGAKRAGFRLAVQILHDYDHGERDEGAAPDAVITCMAELVDILRNEMEKDAAVAEQGPAGTQPIVAVFFDAGDVLYHRPHKAQRLRELFTGLGIDYGSLALDETRDIEQQAYRGLINRDQYREALLRQCGLSQPDQIEKGKRIFDEEDGNVVFFDGVRETLKALKDKGYLLGIITDTATPIHEKLSWFERGGFGDVWDSITSSMEIGVRKPHPKIYHAALQQMGIPASQAVFVGHKGSELDGAKRVGMRTIAFNHEENATADYYIERFSDLLKVPIVGESVTV